MYALDLSNRVILLTGATGRLGPALADGLAAAGARLMLTARDVPRLAEAKARLISTHGGTVEFVSADLTHESGCHAVIDAVRRVYGQLDGIVCNAHAGVTGGVTQLSPQDFRENYEHHVVAPFGLLKASLDLLRDAGKRHAGGAAVINIASMYASVSPDPRIYPDENSVNPASYGAAKAGMLQLTRYLACSLAPFKIRVNSVSPGPFPPPEIATSSPDFHRQLTAKVPLGRTGEPEELAGIVVLLASDRASYITGADIRVDGGWTAW